MTAVDIRRQLVDAVRLDLVGPGEAPGSNDAEVLPEPPSRWYLTGFLVPLEADEGQRSDEAGGDELDQASDAGGLEDAVTPESAAAKRSFFPSSIGLSFLVGSTTKKLVVRASWGDYQPKRPSEGQPIVLHWQRISHTEEIVIDLPVETPHPLEKDVPNSQGLKIAVSIRPVHSDGKEGGIPKGTRSVSLFLVNRRMPAPDDSRDTAFAFQAQLEVASTEGFVPRPNLRSLESKDWDECVADLQYRDVCEFAVGHSVSTDAIVNDGVCRILKTCWIPQAEVERVAPMSIPGVELSMDALGKVTDGKDAEAKLGPLVMQYSAWIDSQKGAVPASPKKRRETGEELLRRAKFAASRIEAGIKLLADPACLEAFRIANRTMAEAARRRQGVFLGKDPASINPSWRPFQLAFLLMNLPGIADPKQARSGSR